MPAGRALPATIVDTCLRAGRGGSATVVLDDAALSDAERRRVPVLAETSHAVFLGPAEPDGTRPLRFFTQRGELPACGHGTLAAATVLAERHGGNDYRTTVRTAAGGRTTIWATLRPTHVEAGFDQGPVEVREPTPDEECALLDALGVTSATLHPGHAPAVASPGRPRLLIPLIDRQALGALTPDHARLRDVSLRLGLLGCFVYTPSSATDRVAARMFAPAIGVREDIANGNSTGCLAAYLADRHGAATVEVDMGDSLGRPATISATAQRTLHGLRPRITAATRARARAT